MIQGLSHFIPFFRLLDHRSKYLLRLAGRKRYLLTRNVDRHSKSVPQTNACLGDNPFLNLSTGTKQIGLSIDEAIR